MISPEQFDLTPERARELFNRKGLRQTFSYAEMLRDEHAAAFTVAKMMDDDLLSVTKRYLDKAITDGKTIADFEKEITPYLQRRGWWGTVTSEDGNVLQLGSTARLETIFRSNLQSAYAVGAWESIEDNAEIMPYLMYDAVDDNRTREDHAALDNIIRPINSPFWRSHYPPNGWNCRCGVIQLSEEDIDSMGLEVSEEPKIGSKEWLNPATGQIERVPVGTDPGWNSNPGMWHRQTSLARALANKTVRADRPLDKIGNHLMSVPIQNAYQGYITDVITNDLTRQLVFPVGVMTDRVYLAMQDRGVQPASGIFELEDRLIVGRKSQRKRGQGTQLTVAQWRQIPSIMSEPDAIYWHRDKGTLVYVMSDPTSPLHTIKVVVKPNTKGSAGRRFDSVRTASRVESRTIDDLVRNGVYEKI